MTTTFFYAAVGEDLSGFEVDVDQASLTPVSTTSLPARVQYVWPHPARNIIYVVSSNGGPRDLGDKHHATSFRVDAVTGALTPVGGTAPLRARPIHCSVDRAGEYLLIAYNTPSMVTVHKLSPGGGIGDEVEQDAQLDLGVYLHQIMASPSNETLIMPTRGNDEKDGQPPDTGSIKVYGFKSGKLDPLASSSAFPEFGPRHVVFHPSGKWMYLSVERQNRLLTYSMETGSMPSTSPTFDCSSLGQEQALEGRQIACAIHVHPNGQFLYQSNRSGGFYEEDGWRLAHTNEDSIAAFSINQESGEPTPIQHIDVPGVHTRTFSLHPSGKLLVAGTVQPVPVKSDGGGVRIVPSALMVYRVAEDGMLSFARSYEMNTLGKLMFWTGMITLPES